MNTQEFVSCRLKKTYTSNQSIKVEYEYVEPSYLQGTQLIKDNLIHRTRVNACGYRNSISTHK